MADYLDLDMGLIFDSKGNELKATPYFEDYLYKVIATIGGEGSTLVNDLESIALQSDKFPYFFGLLRKIAGQIDEIKNESDNPALNAAVKQILIDTAAFIGTVETSNYTAENKDWVEARSGITVDLPADPLPNHQVMISNGDGTVISVDGNGNDIKYTSTDTTLILKRNGSSLHFQYFVAVGESYWRAR